MKKARFMIVYPALYCVKGNKGTQTRIYTCTHITMSGRTQSKLVVVVTYLPRGREQGGWVMEWRSREIYNLKLFNF